MKVLVTGGTGNVGGNVVAELLKRGADVRVLARKQPDAGKAPAGAEVVIGDLLDPVAVERAMQGVDKLFLLNAVSADELTQALIAYDIAKRIGLKHVTYLSVLRCRNFGTCLTSHPSLRSRAHCVSMVCRTPFCAPATTFRTILA